LFVASPDVGDTQIKKAIHSVQVGGMFEEDFRLVGSWAPAGIENDPRVSQLDVTGIFRFDHFAAKNSNVEFLLLFLSLYGEEMCDEQAFRCDRSVWQIHTVSPVIDTKMRRKLPWIWRERSIRS
jgi:hypothetical protein